MTEDVETIEIAPQLAVRAMGVPAPAYLRAVDWLNRRGGVLAVAVGFGLLGGFTHSFSPAPYALLGAGLVAVAVGMVANRNRRLPLPARPTRRGYVVWALIVVLFSMEEIANVILGSVRAHPSLSVLMDPVVNSYPGRAAALFVWMWAGIELMRR